MLISWLTSLQNLNKVYMFLCTKLYNFPQNFKISLQVPTFPSKELPKFPTFSNLAYIPDPGGQFPTFSHCAYIPDPGGGGGVLVQRSIQECAIENGSQNQLPGLMLNSYSLQKLV